MIIYPRQQLILFFRFLILLLGIIPVNLIAQPLRQYDSIYQPMIGHSGHARFTFLPGKNETISKQGAFSFESRVKDSLQPALFIYENWMGQYEANKKQGNWVYKKTRQLVHVEDIDKWDVKYQLKTEERVLNASYTLGNPDKEWELKRTVFVNKKPVSETEYFKSTIKQERLDGRIEFYYIPDSVRSCKVLGYARNGLMDSSWVFEIKSGDSLITETRKYKNGFLLELTKVYQNDTIVKLSYPLSHLIRNAINTSSGENQAINHPVSLSFSDGYPRTSPLILEQVTGNQYLELLLKQIFQYEPNWIAEKGLPLGTNRGFYVLSQKEKALLENWPELEFSYREKVKKIRADIDTIIIAGTQPELQFIQQWTSKQESLLNYIKPWNNILTRNEIEYYHRSGELVAYAEQILAQDTILMSDSSQKIIPYKISELEKQDFLQYISSNFKKRNVVADSLLKELGNLQQTLLLQSQNKKLIQDILTMRKETAALLEENSADSTIKNLQTYLKDHFLTDEYNRLFSTLDSDTESSSANIKNTADSIKYLLSSIQMVQEIATTLPSRTKKIDSLYTIYTFDPFTFNDRFPRRIKKKLYEIIAVDLYNEQLDAILTYNSISEIKNGIKQLYEIQERLLFLHDKDTRKIERKLKRGSSAASKLEVIKV